MERMSAHEINRGKGESIHTIRAIV
jgi:hypothetical protein